MRSRLRALSATANGSRPGADNKLGLDQLFNRASYGRLFGPLADHPTGRGASLKAEEVMGMAEAAALFLRRLTDEGVPLSSATSMASSFVTALILKRAPEPKEPWEEK